MASLFNQDPGPQPPLDPYSRERIEKEVSHPETGARCAVRAKAPPPLPRGMEGDPLRRHAPLALFHGPGAARASSRRCDPRLSLPPPFRQRKKGAELLATGIFAPNEIALLNQRSGAFQDYYPGPGEGNRAADSVIRYLQGVTDLRNGDYEKLNWVGKIRYQLFVRFGLHPPTRWKLLDPAINH